MTWILWLLAAACVIYYVVIVIYSGFTTSFSFIWMVFAAACLLLALGWEYYMKHKDRVPLWLPVSVITFCCTGILVFSMVEILIFTGVASRDTSHLDYLEENPGTVLVLSGGQGEDEPVSEAAAMRDYLLFNGVNERQLILETRSFSTVENIAYSRVAIEEDQARRKAYHARTDISMDPGIYEVIEEKPLKIGVLTSDYHVFRAEWARW